MKSFSIENYDELFSAVLKLSDVEECRRFFEDICTIKELDAILQRLQVAKMLKKKLPYQEISAKCGASTATISRVNKCLLYGEGGYDIVISDGESDANE
ncbi:MAG: helix-turn-helix domain-containing protein [Clostridia bacterium]|nr:helix-turn-helix domain-containing protein [Clostridia bacterium]